MAKKTAKGPRDLFAKIKVRRVEPIQNCSSFHASIVKGGKELQIVKMRTLKVRTTYVENEATKEERLEFDKETGHCHINVV